MTEKMVSAVGQSLIAIGLYTVSFESMVLSFRGRMYAYLRLHDPGSLKAFLKACNTADKTFKFCAPKLVGRGVLQQTDIDALKAMRERRNMFAHEGYNEMMSLTISDVEADVQLMYGITRKVELWRLPALQTGVMEKRTVSEKRPQTETRQFSISPAIFGMYLQIAREIGYSKLPLTPEREADLK